MKTFGDRLVDAVLKKGNPCVVGLDPRVDLMPEFVKAGRGTATREVIRSVITDFHELVLDAVAGLVPAVKPQLAFFEQYGSAGMEAFENTVRAARQRGLLVIADGKRNDISSTAEAYAAAFLGSGAFDADALTVTPYLGRDSLLPFTEACQRHGKGLFVILKTSNPGSKDFQDQILQGTGRPLYDSIAAVLDELGRGQVGAEGYSSIGAVVGATFPEEARRLRALMPRAYFLVPGYGAQGGSAQNAAVCFNEDGLGAVVNSSRGITYAFGDPNISRDAFVRAIRGNLLQMIEDVSTALKSSVAS
jgi:orotidine-5'-phosphate decarboxylase